MPLGPNRHRRKVVITGIGQPRPVSNDHDRRHPRKLITLLPDAVETANVLQRDRISERPHPLARIMWKHDTNPGMRPRMIEVIAIILERTMTTGPTSNRAILLMIDMAILATKSIMEKYSTKHDQ